MKKSLKLLSAAFVAIMLLSAVATPVAMAATTDTFGSIIVNPDLYILEQIWKGNCIPMANGDYWIPSVGVVDGDKVNDLRDKYWTNLYPSYGPTFPGFSGLQVINVEMNQYERKTLAMGTSYTYTSLDPDIVTVDQYGTLYAVGSGTATISLSVDGLTWMLVNVTVKAVEFDPADFAVDIVIGKTLLQIGDSVSVYARLLKDGYYVPMGDSYIKFSVEDEDVLKLTGSMLTAVGIGKTTVTAYIPDTTLSETMEIQVINKLETPSYPGMDDIWYPSYGGNWFPGLGDVWYPTPDGNWYPPYGGNWYPGLGDVLFPGLGSNFFPYGLDLAEWIGLDSDVYKVTYKMMFWQGEWQQVLVAVPKDGDAPAMKDYTVRYKLIYKDGDWSYIPYMVPKNMIESAPETPEVPEEEDKVDSSLTKEEQEALKKAEEEAKKLAELKKQIAKALEGKLEWYEVYTDLNGDASYYDGVTFVLNKQYLTGKDNGKFGTKDKMTFNDVKELLIKYTELTTAEFDKTGILTFEDGEKEITRQEISMAFYKLAAYLKEDVSGRASMARYKDKGELSAEYSNSFAWAIKNKVILTTSEKMSPKANVTRGDLALILYRFDKFAK